VPDEKQADMPDGRVGDIVTNVMDYVLVGRSQR
jgi:hypothetical protein